MKSLFITGIGTGIGKTLVSAIITRALAADYWKPVQAGYAQGTDSEWIKSQTEPDQSNVHPETYLLKLAASPHIAARDEDTQIALEVIEKNFTRIKKVIAVSQPSETLVIEGAGGLLVPLNEKEFVADLIKMLRTPVILVSRNYLGSINHSLLTAQACKQFGLPVAGWIFNDQYLQYEDEIVAWSGFPKIASIPRCEKPDKNFINEQSALLGNSLVEMLSAIESE
jgi:dethiobiotin synthetase